MNTRAFLTGIAALFLATGTAHAEYCAVVLQPPAKVKRDKDFKPDMWLSVREEPTKQSKIKYRVGTCDLLYIAVDLHPSEWASVDGVPRLDGDKDKYRVTGYISSKYIQQFPCEEDQKEEGRKPLPAPKIQTFPTTPSPPPPPSKTEYTPYMKYFK